MGVGEYLLKNIKIKNKIYCIMILIVYCFCFLLLSWTWVIILDVLDYRLLCDRDYILNLFLHLCFCLYIVSGALSLS